MTTNHILPDSIDPNQQSPVTVSISRRVKTGREKDYEVWVHGIIEAASVFKGHQGVNILRPSTDTDGQYVLIYRFDNWVNCNSWENSRVRANWVSKLDDITEGEAQTNRVTGLEFWFDLPEVPVVAHPAQYKMALVLIVVVFCLVYPMQQWLGPLLIDWPSWARSLLIVVIQVLLMTYIVMPRVTRFLKGWLFD